MLALNTHVHDSDATLARHIARFDAIATSCGSVTPCQSVNMLGTVYVHHPLPLQARIENFTTCARISSKLFLIG